MWLSFGDPILRYPVAWDEQIHFSEYTLGLKKNIGKGGKELT